MKRPSVMNWLMSPTEIKVDEKGEVKAVVVEKMQLDEPDKSGRRRPVPTGEHETFECDTVIYALGTRANPVISRSTPDLAVRGEGNVNADAKTQTTNLPGDEEHICCAGERITCTCTSCQKVSEGFAFPYGLCPACGGALELGHDVSFELRPPCRRSGRPSRSSWGASRSPLAARRRSSRWTLTSHTSSASCRRWRRAPRDLARALFLDAGRKFPTGSHEWRLYRELEAEEREHIGG